ncbi:MAG: hypothetical protein WCX27_01430 [Candidatus Paceibacterota bacterium]|jgi:hypothetical protein
MSRFLKQTIYIAFALLLVLFAAKGVSLAQVSGSADQTLSISSSPQNPGANDLVDLEVSSYSVNLDAARISWYVDGTARTEGQGTKTFTVRAKDSGQTTIIKAVVETPDGTISEISKEITPAGVDLVVEPMSYTPPFYPGKALFASQGTVRIIAIPNVIISGKKASSKNLIFRWEKDDVIQSDSSGTGKDSLTVSGGVPIRDISVDVSVIDSSGTVLAEGSKVISVNDPKIIFYENNPLYGILGNRAISDSYYLGQREEVKIIAKPYFFDLSSDSGSDSTYEWYVNGASVATTGRTNELILRQANTNLKGSAAITLNVGNISRIFQFANAGFNVTFGQ